MKCLVKSQVWYPDWKGRKVSPFTDGMILYIENLKEPQKLSELISGFGKVAGYN